MKEVNSEFKTQYNEELLETNKIKGFTHSDDDEDDENFEDSNPFDGEGDESEERMKNEKEAFLNSFCDDLTRKASEGNIGRIYGREKEVNRTIEILKRKKKSNPMLLGEPGVGKTSIADALAIKIAENDVPLDLLGKRILSLNVGALVSGTKYRGQLEERITNLIKVIKTDPDIILFIDEIHTIIGGGNSSGGLDIANMLKPSLSSGEIKVIGATTSAEYEKIIKQDGALKRRFQSVLISEPNDEETKTILGSLAMSYSEHHLVIYSDEIINKIISLSSRYITGNHNPDKSIDVMDEVGAKIYVKNNNIPEEILEIDSKIKTLEEEKIVNKELSEYEKCLEIKNQIDELTEKRKSIIDSIKTNDDISLYKEITESDIREVISSISGVPIQNTEDDELTLLKTMEETLNSKLIGQSNAVSVVSKAIKRSKMGIGKPNKPILSSLMIGNTGVGKTELAKQLAIHMFGTDKALIRLDMSEYSTSEKANNITGSSAGYVGYDEGSSFLNEVKKRPYSVILLDEIEKAHPSIFNLFLQILDDGHMTDNKGEVVSFKNTIILMTSNVGLRTLRDFGKGVGFSSNNPMDNSSNRTESILKKELNKCFSPEFLNRIDEVTYFNDLNKEDIMKILDIELKKTMKLVEEKNITFTLSDKAKEFLVGVGYKPEFGARQLKREITNYVENIIADEMINNPSVSHINIDVNEDSSTLIVI